MTSKIIEIEFKRDKKPFLFVKTCVEFEEYLKKNGKLEKTDNFLDQKEKTEFYTFENGLFSAHTDVISRGLFNFGNLNRCFLRVKGISKGIKINLEKAGIINLERLESEIRGLLKEFKTFYKNNISKVTIKGSLELNDL